MNKRETLVMTPGPTAVPEPVRKAMAQPIQNPDVDPAFGEYYRTLLDKLAKVYQTDKQMVVLGGEGILGLEASIASLIEPGEEVLCLSNGIFGDGFADFVEMHGGNAESLRVPFTNGFDVNEIAARVNDPGHDFVAATMVHCETPTGLLNDLNPILDVLNEAGILTIVDAVSSLGGTPVPVEKIDICLGASQKCFSSPPGLTTVSISDRAWEEINVTDQNTFYTNLAPWQDIEPIEKTPTAFPYTHLVSNLYALEASLDRMLEEGMEAVYERHADVAEYCRIRGSDLGLEPFPANEEHYSPTVTAFEVEASASRIQNALYEEHNILIATSIGELQDDLIRIGHMGYGADHDRVEQTMNALEAVLTV